MKRLLITVLVLFLQESWASRLKDVATLRGVRDNQLSGYGVVIGLAGTGDKGTDFLTENSLGMVLKGMGIDLKAQKIETKNAASVIVSAILPPFARVGARLDSTVSSLSTASSLEGGLLLATPIRGADGKVYAMAQGKLITAKKSEKGGASSSGQNSLTALIPAGALLERELSIDLLNQRELKYFLHSADFTTSARVARRINEELGGKYATATDAGSVDVIVPYGYEGSFVDLVAQIENVDVESDIRAKVVINPKSGTVILGEHVQIRPCAIAHSNFRVEVKEENREPSSAEVAAKGTEPSGNVAATTPPKKSDKKVVLMDRGTNIADIVVSLNEMGATSEDLISILQSLRASGALLADLEIQ